MAFGKISINPAIFLQMLIFMFLLHFTWMIFFAYHLSTFECCSSARQGGWNFGKAKVVNVDSAYKMIPSNLQTDLTQNLQIFRGSKNFKCHVPQLLCALKDFL